MFRIAVAFVALLTASAAHAAPPMAPAEARATALDFAGKLEKGYMDPAIGAAYAAMLRANAAAGAYDDIAEPAAFAEKITADLEGVHSDAHLRLLLAGEPPPPRVLPGATMPPPPPDAVVGDIKWIADKVAYAEWFLFASDEPSIAAARKLMKDYAGAKALIIDIRRHRGGALGEMDAMFSCLFAGEQHLVTMKIREGKGAAMAEMFDHTPFLRRQSDAGGVLSWEHWTRPLPCEGAWPDVPVYVLTSRRSASAAEHFTLSLKTTGRATIVGEPTRGAGHFGGFEDIGTRFTAFMPVGETIDPKTGLGWEGTGIAPDVEVAAPEALDKALALIEG